MNLRFRPIALGYNERVNLSMLTYMANFGVQQSVYNYIWLIEGAETPIIVDAGTGSKELVKKLRNVDLIATPEQEPAAALRILGVEPEKVEVVIQTHLHADHCLGFELNLFPNAEVYIQQSEIQFAACPYPPFRNFYDYIVVKRFIPAWNTDVGKKVKLINGDYKLANGIELLHLPGHTPGLMGVALETRKGIYVMPSDTVAFRPMWEGWLDGRWIPNNVHVNLDDYCKSMSRIAHIADYVIPSHCSSVLEHHTYPFEE